MLRPAVIALKAIIVLGLLACMGAQTAMVLAAVNTFGESLQKLVTSTIVVGTDAKKGDSLSVKLREQLAL